MRADSLPPMVSKTKSVRIRNQILLPVSLVAFILMYNFSHGEVVPSGSVPLPLHWIPLPPIPDAEGFAGGFAGVSHDALLFAGGANFVGGRPWNGGTKRWYDTIYVLTAREAHWKAVGKLLHVNGYGVSGSFRDEFILAVGGAKDKDYSDVLALYWDGLKLHQRQLPPLPQSRAFTGGTVVQNTLYVGCGIEKPQATATEAMRNVWALDLARPQARWR